MQNWILPKFLLALTILWIRAHSQDFKVSSVDEVIQKTDQILLFKYSQWTYKSVSMNTASKGSKKVVSSDWKKLVKPDFRFSPRQILQGQSNNFLVWEDEGKRIWQLDSGMQILSSITLPEEFQGAVLEGYRLSYAIDHKFNFIHTSRGKVLQFTESNGKLRLHREIKIPIMPGGCLQVSWKGNHSLSQYPYLCIENKKVQFYTLFFTGAKELSLTELLSREKNNQGGEPFMSPMIVKDKGIHSILKYQLNAQTFCFSSQRSEFYSCSN